MHARTQVYLDLRSGVYSERKRHSPLVKSGYIWG